MIKSKGYRFVSLEEAMKDKAYQLKDNYVGSRGISWIHRIAITKGMKMKWEPREPPWLKKLAFGR